MRSPHTATGGEEESHRANQVMRSPHTSYRWRGERVIEPIKCMLSPHKLQVERRESHRANQVDAHTPATGGEKRVIEPIKCMRSPPPATGGEERES